MSRDTTIKRTMYPAACLSKPFTAVELLERVQALLALERGTCARTLRFVGGATLLRLHSIGRVGLTLTGSFNLAPWLSGERRCTEPMDHTSVLRVDCHIWTTSTAHAVRLFFPSRMSMDLAIPESDLQQPNLRADPRSNCRRSAAAYSST